MASSPIRTEVRPASVSSDLGLTSSQLYHSVFRHGYADSVRNRALEVTSNVFLHLHPITIPRRR